MGVRPLQGKVVSDADLRQRKRFAAVENDPHSTAMLRERQRRGELDEARLRLYRDGKKWSEVGERRPAGYPVREAICRALIDWALREN